MDKFSWHEGKGAKWYLLFKKKKKKKKEKVKKKLKTLKTTFYETALKALCGGLFKKISSLRKIKCQLHRHLAL